MISFASLEVCPIGRNLPAIAAARGCAGGTTEQLAKNEGPELEGVLLGLVAVLGCAAPNFHRVENGGNSPRGGECGHAEPAVQCADRCRLRVLRGQQPGALLCPSEQHRDWRRVLRAAPAQRRRRR